MRILFPYIVYTCDDLCRIIRDDFQSFGKGCRIIRRAEFLEEVLMHDAHAHMRKLGVKQSALSTGICLSVLKSPDVKHVK